MHEVTLLHKSCYSSSYIHRLSTSEANSIHPSFKIMNNLIKSLNSIEATEKPTGWAPIMVLWLAIGASLTTGQVIPGFI